MPTTTVKTKSVKVAKLPGKLVKVEFDDDGNMTVEQALEESGITVSEDQDVKHNGADADLKAPVADGDRVTVAAGAKGA
jgi:hypothetical protein